MDQLFNNVFIVFMSGLFWGRFFFVAFHFNSKYLNPLVFFIVPYFPGLSLTGGILGGFVTTYYFLKTQTYPAGRVFDFFSLSFLWFISFALSSEFILALIQKKSLLAMGFSAFLFIIVLIFFIRILLPRQKRGDMKDGSMAFLFLISFSAIIFLIDIFSKTKKIILFFSPDDLLAFLLFTISLIFLFRNEKILIKFKKWNQK